MFKGSVLISWRPLFTFWGVLSVFISLLLTDRNDDGFIQIF